MKRILIALAACLVSAVVFTGCSAVESSPSSGGSASSLFASSAPVQDRAGSESSAAADSSADARSEAASSAGEESPPSKLSDGADGRSISVDEARAALRLTEDYRASFVHGDKPAAFQKYIVLHDTESGGDPSGIVNYWDGNGAGVAAHFIVDKDGSIIQCVPLDSITHHAGYGDAGHNDAFGVVEDGRDDMVGTVPIGDWAPDYGMNAWSIGIEMMHVSGEGDYPEAQLVALDNLIAYIDCYYGFESAITDHKAWRSGNSDTSPEFAGYLANYQDHRTHS